MMDEIIYANFLVYVISTYVLDIQLFKGTKYKSITQPRHIYYKIYNIWHHIKNNNKISMLMHIKYVKMQFGLFHLILIYLIKFNFMYFFAWARSRRDVNQNSFQINQFIRSYKQNIKYNKNIIICMFMRHFLNQAIMETIRGFIWKS